MFTHRTIEVAYKNFIKIFNKALNSMPRLIEYTLSTLAYAMNKICGQENLGLHLRFVTVHVNNLSCLSNILKVLLRMNEQGTETYTR